MNSSNEKKSNFGQAAVRFAAYIVLLNAVLSGCAGSLGSNRAGIVGESEIYQEIKVVGPVADPRRVRIRKKIGNRSLIDSPSDSTLTDAPTSPAISFEPLPAST